MSIAADDAAATSKSNGPVKQYVTFSIDNRHYGIEITNILEIKQWTETTPLPNQPHYTHGVLNMRGVVIPVHDLRARFGGMLETPSANHVIVIARVGQNSVGIVVDGVSDIVTVSPEEIRSVPPGSREMDSAAISGLISRDESMIALLNLNELFATNDFMAA